MRQLFYLLCLLLAISPAVAQNRSFLQGQTNKYIVTNSQGAITEPILNNLIQQIISGTANQSDNNVFSGANSHSGTETFTGPVILPQTGILVGNGTSAATAITPGTGVLAALQEPLAASGGLMPTVGTVAQLEALSSTYAPSVLRIGYYAANDKTPPVVLNSSSSPCSLNSGAGDGGSQFPSSNGGCWSANFTSTGLDPREWGVVGTGVANSSPYPTYDTAAITSFFTYLNNLPIPKTGAEYFVSLQGLSITTQNPLTHPKDTLLKGGTFVAETGTNWCATDTSVPIPSPTPAGGATTIGRSTCGVLTIPSSAYGITDEDVFVDVNRIPNVTGVYCLSTGNIEFRNLNIRHWVSGGAGFISDYVFGTGACSSVHFNDNFQEWVAGVDPEYNVASDQFGVALGVWSYDNTFHGGNYALTLVPIYLATSASTNIFLASHPYNGPMCIGGSGITCSGGVITAWGNPNGIINDGFANNLDDTYLDSVPMLVRVSSITNSTRPQFIMTNTRAVYNSSNTTFSGWVQFSTSVANTPLWNVLACGSWPNTAVTAPFPSFATSGGGSWALSSAQLSQIEGATGDTCLNGVGSSSTVFSPSLAGLGLSNSTGFNKPPVFITATSYTFSASDTDQTDVFNAGSAVTLTTPATPVVGGWTVFSLPNATGTIQAASGGAINGLTVPISLLANKQYMLTFSSGTGANANYRLTSPGVDLGASPTLGGSCSSVGSVTGNSQNGNFSTTGSCSGTISLTFPYGAPNKWTCAGLVDTTTTGDTFKMSAITSISVTFTGTAASGDVLNYNNCLPY